jgi:hypothetical protein
MQAELRAAFVASGLISCEAAGLGPSTAEQRANSLLGLGWTLTVGRISLTH